MTESPQSQPPHSGIPGPGGYPPPQQGPYGQQLPYGQPPQAPYGLPQYGQPGAYGYGPPPPAKNNNAKIGLAVGLGLLLLVGGSVVFHIARAAHRDSNGTITKKGALDATSLKVGDCMASPPTDHTKFTSVTAIPCTQPHSAQIYAVYTYPNASSDMPSVSDIEASAKSRCPDLGKNVLDMDKIPADADLVYLYPESKAWSDGKHDIQCVVSSSSTQLTSSVLK